MSYPKTTEWSRTAYRGRFIGRIPVESLKAVSWGSPRVGGKLKLQSNPYSREWWVNTVYQYDGRGASAPPIVSTAGGTSQAKQGQASAYSEAYGRLRGRLYKGSASLGVTIGSYRQSREMIVNRSRSIITQAEEILSDYGRRRGAGRRASKRLADNYLETVFGWKPLLEDIHKSCVSVIQLADQVDSVAGRAHRTYRHVYHNVSSGGGVKRTSDTQISGNVYVTVACLVTISNPNRWLAERAGLLNPAAVAWDLVPWSFVVNMFANTGQLVNSITDFAGLTFHNESTTTTHRESGQGQEQKDIAKTSTSPSHHSIWSSAWRAARKSRTVGAIARPSLVFKLPNADWELAATAAALMTQKVTSVFGAIRTLRGPAR